MRLLILFLLVSSQLFSQNFLSKDGDVKFFSETPLENIEALNKSVAGVINLSTGEFAFRLKITDFIFEKPLMQEHFNENYLESDKFPLSTFTGVIKDINKFDFSSKQKVEVSGDLLIHGVIKKQVFMSEVWMQNGVLNLESEFKISLEDYDIDIPKIVFYNIAEVIDVQIKMELKKIENE
jgi:hypothetical protein